MSQFLTEKQRQDIKNSIGEIRSILFKVETTMHLDSDENILYHLNDEAKVRLNFIIEFMKGADMYKYFCETNGKAELKRP